MKFGVAILAIMCLLFAGLLTAAAQEQRTQEQGEAALIEGLDGAPYEACEPSVVEDVQQALKDQDLYQGEVTRVLDEATMEAIAEFQRQNGIMVNGIPTPNTREALGLEE